MRRGAALALLFVLAVGGPAFADDDQDGRAHFKNGVGLFRDGNFSGALAEFQESNRLRPSSTALSNMALCQKALFRYSEAIATLQQELALYGATLPPAEVATANATMAELAARVTKVTLSLTPKGATLSIDGRPVRGPFPLDLTLDVGEHVFLAEAPRFRTLETRISVAGAEKKVDLELQEDAGTLVVTASDHEAAIAVDGVHVGYGSYTGTVSAGVLHTVQIYKPKHKTTAIEVTLSSDETRSVEGLVGPEDDESKTPFPYVRPPPPVIHGPYALLTGAFTELEGDPDNFKTPKDSSRNGAYFGFRLGYRIVTSWGVETVFDAGKTSVGPGCYSPASTDCTVPTAGRPVYDLTSQRFGAAARYFGKSQPFGFVAAAGLGYARHTVSIEKDQPTSYASGSDTAGNAFFAAEAGGHLFLSGAIIEVVALFDVDGVNNLDVAGTRVYKDHGNVITGGIGARLGYGLW